MKIIKILEIVNYHQWDDMELTIREFDLLIETLKLGKYYFSCTFEKQGIIPIQNISNFVRE